MNREPADDLPAPGEPLPSPHGEPGGGDPLARDVRFVPGIGPRRAAALAQQGIRCVRDLLFHVPRRYLDRSSTLTVAEVRAFLADPLRAARGADPRREVTVIGEVASFRVMGAGRRARLAMTLADDTGSLQCVWFGGVPYWRRTFRTGMVLAVSGVPAFYRGIPQVVHPAVDRLSSPGAEEEGGAGKGDWRGLLHTGGLVPLYPSGQDLERAGLDSGGFRRLIRQAMHLYLDQAQETLPAGLRREHGLVDFSVAIRNIHFPPHAAALEESRRRLAYEELFLFQVRLALHRRRIREEPGIPFKVESALARRLVDSLPFRLTSEQVKVVREIAEDMRLPRPLNRLLQGDVGSGKTVVALIATLIAVENGYQTVFMAPTEILAEQHHRTLAGLLGDLPVTIRLLVGAQPARLRRDILEDVRRGTAQMLVGTHALFEKGVEFANLGFIVIDEQHRFGVLQRATIRSKGRNPDVLVMTATPIPRTLSLTLFGDLDVSVMRELPPGRIPVRTLLREESRLEEVYDFVREQVRRGRQAYFVYPLIEESEKVDLRAAAERFDRLRGHVFPDLRVGLMHGRLESGEKEEVMRAFKAGELDILAATTVIEVGIDVPNATVMVIENAERFGLAQLHQLRGRVGRGSDQSFCILVPRSGYSAASSGQGGEDLARERLAALVATTDGFRIAEADLRLRGPGDFFGTRQSGIPEFRVADLTADGPLLEQARTDAFRLVASDPGLAREEHRMVADHLRTYHAATLPLLRVG
ncbi:MAG: ATP-dependent DNA helicase RecG [Bacteroidota bacterium]